MKDYINEFKKQKNRKNAFIILSSLVFAFSLNAFLFGTNVGTKLQTSVKNYSTEKTDKEVNSDLYMKKSGTGSDVINLFAGNKMNKVSELRLSLIADPGVLTINDVVSENKDVEIIKTSNVPGITMIVVRFLKPADIDKNEQVAKFVYTKSGSATTSLNLSETQFVSDKEIFDLVSNSLEF